MKFILNSHAYHVYYYKIIVLYAYFHRKKMVTKKEKEKRRKNIHVARKKSLFHFCCHFFRSFAILPLFHSHLPSSAQAYARSQTQSSRQTRLKKREYSLLKMHNKQRVYYIMNNHIFAIMGLQSQDCMLFSQVNNIHIQYHTMFNISLVRVVEQIMLFTV